MRYAVIEAGTVVNVILWDGSAPYAAGSGRTLVQSDTANIGDTYNSGDGTFTPAN